MARDSDIAQAVKVLARAHQDAVWDRQQVASKTRSLLRQYFPSFLTTFDDLTTMGARVVLAMAPTPAAAAKLRVSSVAAALRRGGRRRGIPDEAAPIVVGLRAPQLRQTNAVENAMGRQAVCLARSLAAAADNVAALEVDLTAVFESHPDAAIIKSFPGLGTVLGARLLGEIGDHRERFATARGLKAYAGTAPVTRASGMKSTIDARRTEQASEQRRLPVGAAVDLALDPCPGSLRPPPQTRDSHTAASRNLVNRHLGMLHHCLTTNQPYDPEKGYPHLSPSTEVAVAS